jgi:hypothetical protein
LNAVKPGVHVVLVPLNGPRSSHEYNAVERPQARIDLRRLSALRSELGVGRFASLLADAVGDAELAESVALGLDQLDNADDSAD